MSKTESAVELDFFGMENLAAASSKPPQPPTKLFQRRRSFRDIQFAISKINPEVVKNVIASAASANSKAEQRLFPALPVYAPSPRTTTVSSAADNGGGGDTAPLTIFYDGTVSVFDVRRLEAEKIIKIVQESLFKTADSADSNLANTDGDFPLQRRKSLQRFLEKRKSRLVMVSPYVSPAEHAFSGNTALGNEA